MIRSVLAKMDQLINQSNTSQRYVRSLALDVIRPGDANEVTEAWKKIITRGKAAESCCLVKNLPVFDRTECEPASGTAKGAYILKELPNPKAILIATGSEGFFGDRCPDRTCR
jgi:transketolase